MMRSLFSGVAGLKTHQTRMDVIGNNIANVNTVAFKSSSMNFQDMLYQTTQAATGANSDTGRAGQNPRQIGLGSTTASINTTIDTAGSAESTGNPFDIYITGDSFFVVSPDGGGTQYYTRSGAFNVDEAGTLCMTSNGYAVMGYGTTTDTTGAVVVDTSALEPLAIMSSDNMTSAPDATTYAYMSGIIDSEDESFDTTTGKMVTLQFYDNLGYKYTAKFTITQTSDTEYALTVSDVVDSDGTSTGGTNTGTATIVFDNTTGALSSTSATSFTLTASGLKGSDASITVDISTLLNYANNGNSTVSMSRGTSSTDTTGCGWAVGSMTGISIGTDGTIYGTYDNGQTALLGQIPTATFANASGLSKEGANLYAASLNSGDATINDITASGSGSMTTGQLEMSNVDLAKEFTTMITTQRGFQANSRIITVSDTLLEELTNLKR
ncbi:flagellar hook protein FlgE [Lachnospiraceae bacterium C1.1]|nr:flagellar hook-basal body complex protein [Lachnospiraceae bacterium C1.1]